MRRSRQIRVTDTGGNTRSTNLQHTKAKQLTVSNSASSLNTKVEFIILVFIDSGRKSPTLKILTLVVTSRQQIRTSRRRRTITSLCSQTIMPIPFSTRTKSYPIIIILIILDSPRTATVSTTSLRHSHSQTKNMTNISHGKRRLLTGKGIRWVNWLNVGV